MAAESVVFFVIEVILVMTNGATNILCFIEITKS